MELVAARSIQALSLLSAGASFYAVVEAPSAASIATVLAGSAAFIGTAGIAQKKKNESSKATEAAEPIAAYRASQASPYDPVPTPTDEPAISLPPARRIEIASLKETQLYGQVPGLNFPGIQRASGPDSYGDHMATRREVSPSSAMLKAGIALAAILGALYIGARLFS